MYIDANFSTLLGRVLKSVERVDDECYGDTLVFTTDNGEIYKLYHSQDCCESVTIEDICGDLEDLVGEPILEANETSNSDSPKEQDGYTDESFTWTFYSLRTRNGGVTIRWYGSSNGYYSESVSFSQISEF